jgi:hypothetical protein
MADAGSDDRLRGRSEIATVIILSAAGLLSAVAAYQASLWAGVQATAFADANVLRTEAARLDLEVRQVRESQTALVHSWLGAAATGDTRRMRFYENHLTDAQRRAFSAWRAKLPEDLTTYDRPPGAPPIPLPEILSEPTVEVDRVLAQATQQFEEGQQANAISGRYVFANVLLSLVLFLAGISQVLKPVRARIAVLAFSAFIFLGAAIFLIGLPRAAM